MRKIQAFDEIVVDYETTGLYYYKGARVFSYVLTWCDTGESEIYDDDHPLFIQRLREVWGNHLVTVICHNLKFEYKFTISMGIKITATLHDTMIMHQMLENLSPKHSLDYCFFNYCGYDKEFAHAWDEVDKAKKIYNNQFDKVPRELMHSYQVKDGEATALLFKTMYPFLKDDFNYKDEIEVACLTGEIENYGIMVNEKECNDLINFMNKELKDTDEKLTSLIGEQINLNSPKQLQKLLFETYKLPILSYTDSNVPATDKDALEALRKVNNHPIIDLILKNRSYTKGVSMIQSYLDARDSKGILHPNINTNANKTGRASSNDPNMQNVSKEMALKNKYPVPARRCFCARPKTVLYLKDYAGIEMRLGVQGTKSDRLFKLAHENFDFHDACAKSFYGDRYISETDPKMKKALRSSAKNARFAMFYGAGLAQVARTLGLSMEETQVGYEKDKIDFPEFYEFMERCTFLAKKQGYIETFFGRKLKVYANKPYAATDYCIQGTAAQVLKKAKIRLFNYYQKEFKGEIKLLLDIHDEIITEFPRSLFSQRNEILKEIRKLMITFDEIQVPLEIETKMTTTLWSKAK